ncbi:MAG: hypothetical protein K6G61_09395 [Solobacterium sp.]|nr:hypothetical protein [Solobacterium sp.]
MEQKLLMAIDLGTSFVKAGIYDPEGNELAAARKAIKSIQPRPGQFIQHGDDLMAAVEYCMKECAGSARENAAKIAVIGFTGQMAGFMGVDENWNDVTGWSCSLDTRYIPYAEKQNALFADDFYRVSGTNSPLFSSKYAWFKSEFPEEAKRIAKYLMISGYVIGRLSGLPIKEAVIDGSLITWTGLADVRNRCWSRKLCQELGIDPDLLPRIAESSEVVAYLSETAAGRTGLCADIPLVSGAGDKIAGCTGAANLSPGDMLFEAASFGAVSCMTDVYRPDLEQRGYDMLNGSTRGSYCAHYYMPGSGITQEWFISRFYRKENETLKEAYARIDAEIAGIPPGCEGLFAVGMLGGTVMPFNGDLRGVFMGQTWTHTPAHFYRAIVESFAFALKTAIGRMNAMYPQYTERDCIRMIGGGADSEVCAQIYADVLGMPVETLSRRDPALWGSCLLGAKGIGLIDGLEQYAKEHIRIRKRFDPDPEKRIVYDALQERYNRYIGILTPLCRELQKNL